MPGARADPSRSEPAPGPWPSGARAAQKSDGSATLVYGTWSLGFSQEALPGAVSRTVFFINILCRGGQNFYKILLDGNKTEV